MSLHFLWAQSWGKLTNNPSAVISAVPSEEHAEECIGVEKGWARFSMWLKHLWHIHSAQLIISNWEVYCNDSVPVVYSEVWWASFYIMDLLVTYFKTHTHAHTHITQGFTVTLPKPNSNPVLTPSSSGLSQRAGGSSVLHKLLAQLDSSIAYMSSENKSTHTHLPYKTIKQDNRVSFSFFFQVYTNIHNPVVYIRLGCNNT